MGTSEVPVEEFFGGERGCSVESGIEEIPEDAVGFILNF
jgi:hypothetical protein